MKKAIIRVGIRKGSPYVTSNGSFITTADVAKLHEFGGINLPKRSWLFEPAEDFLRANKYNPKNETVEEYADRLKDYIIEGFSTNGHGKWTSSVTKTPYVKKNSGKKVTSGDGINLVDSSQFKNDIEVWIEWVQN